MRYDSILALPLHPVPYGVLGSPINHSLSPLMQQAAFDHLGIEARYYRVEVPEEKLERAVEHLRGVAFGGWNCTVPVKVKMFQLCDQRSESADQFRAVNTVVNEKGRLVGHNTDGTGWSRALREAFDRRPEDLRILVLGAGGAGRAIATQAILEKSPRLLVANRKAGRARELVDHLATQFSGSPLARNSHDMDVVAWSDEALAAALKEVDLVVNTTSAGLDPNEPSILPARLLPPGMLIFDTVYGAGCAKFRVEAEQAGAQWADGLGMLLHQGAAAFSLWTKREAPLEIMRAALQSAFVVPARPPSA